MKRRIRTIDKILPLSPEMPRTLNLLPLLSIHQELDKELNIGYFDGSASISISDSKVDKITNKDHDISIVRDQRNPLTQRVKYIPGNLADITDFRSLKTLSKFYSEFMDLTGALMPEIVMHNTFPIIPMPPLEDEYPILQGLDGLGYYEKGQGNFYGVLRRRFGLSGTRNPHNIIKELMIERRVWKSDYARKIRGLQKLQTILGIEPEGRHKGWQSMIVKPEFLLKNQGQFGIRYPPLMSKICDARTKDKWWLDTGIPRKFLTIADGATIEGAVYLLKKSGYSIPV